MDEALRAALPLFPLTLAPAVLLSFAHVTRGRTRLLLALPLLVVALAFVVDILVISHDHTNTLDVVNVFPRGASGEPYTWIVANASAPAWHWHVVVAAVLGVPALGVLMRRGSAPPNPVAYGVAMFLLYLAARLGLERAAASPALVWATGATPALLVALPFFGWFAGLRRYSFRKFVGALLLTALLQRGMLIGFGYYATTCRTGTHLDTHRITDAWAPIVGSKQFDDPIEGWAMLTLMPHLTFWIIITMVAGIVLGVLPWWLARGRAARAARHAG
jgi:hypothetical protein